MTDTIDNNNDNGIVKYNTKDEEYTFWTVADYIKPYIINFLKERFPGKLIIRELNRIDLCIPEENLPIEVQATSVHGGNNPPSYSAFEQLIEKQINQNIISYGMCWLFFDSELLRAMKNASRSMSINMVWFRNYMKEDKLKVFIVSHDGIIEEKEYKDFDFLAKISQTCPIAAKTDDAILNDNKLKIYTSVVKGYDFTQDEIDKFYDDWREYCKINKMNSTDRNDGFMVFLFKYKNERSRLYGSIFRAINILPTINDILGLKNYQQYAKSYASALGIFDVEGGASNAITRFVNRFNVCQYFPGYLRNKAIWDRLKGHSINSRQFESIVKNGIGNYFWYEEDKNNMVTESGQINDKDVNVTIESKDQIITVNIKGKDNLSCYKTKQKNIEDAWEIS